MKNFLLLISIITIFSACNIDQHMQNDFVGTYEVTLEALEAKKELKKAKNEVNREMEKARQEIEKEFAEAKKGIEMELGEDSNFGQAFGSFLEGMGHFAEGMTELGESLGEMSIDLSSDFLENVHFTAEFQNDGEVHLGKTGKVRIHANDLHWKMENGKFHLWDADNGEDDVQEFKMKRYSSDKWDLIGEEVIFHLRKKE